MLYAWNSYDILQNHILITIWNIMEITMKLFDGWIMDKWNNHEIYMIYTMPLIAIFDG